MTPAHPVDAPTPVEGAVLLERQQIEQIVHDLLNPLTVVRAVSQPIVRNVDRGRPVDASRLVADMHLVNDAVTKAVEEIEPFMVSARATTRASVVPMVLGLEMPVMDGPSCYRALRSRGVAAPVLIQSAAEAVTVAKELGADAALGKPFDVLHLTTLLSQLVSPGVPGSVAPASQPAA